MDTRADFNAPLYRGRVRAFAVAMFILVLAGVYLTTTGWPDYLSLDGLARNRMLLKQFVADHPGVAPIVFMIFHAVAVSLPIAAISKILAGFLFGWVGGGIYAAFAATIGATLLFLPARGASTRWQASRLANRHGDGSSRWASEFESGAFSYILAMRLAPFIPFFATSIVPGLFRVPLTTFVAATFIGILPGAFCFAWLGQGLDDAFASARSLRRPLVLSDLVTWEITAALLALTLVAVLAAIVRRRRGWQTS